MALVTSALFIPQAAETWQISVWTPQPDGGFSRLTVVSLHLLMRVPNTEPGMIDVCCKKLLEGWRDEQPKEQHVLTFSWSSELKNK